MGQIPPIRCQFLEALRWNQRGEKDRVATGLPPDVGVDTPEQLDGVNTPAPPHISGQYLQKFQWFGNRWEHLIHLKMFHGLSLCVLLRLTYDSIPFHILHSGCGYNKILSRALNFESCVIAHITLSSLSHTRNASLAPHAWAGHPRC